MCECAFHISDTFSILARGQREAKRSLRRAPRVLMKKVRRDPKRVQRTMTTTVPLKAVRRRKAKTTPLQVRTRRPRIPLSQSSTAQKRNVTKTQMMPAVVKSRSR